MGSQVCYTWGKKERKHNSPEFCLWHLKICRLCSCVLQQMHKEGATLLLLGFFHTLIFHSFQWLFTSNTFMYERKAMLKAKLTTREALFFFSSMDQWLEIRRHFIKIAGFVQDVLSPHPGDGGCAATPCIDSSRILKESGCELHVVWEQCIVLKAVAVSNWGLLIDV